MVTAQNYEQRKRQALDEYAAFRDKWKKEYTDFREKANAEYAEFIKKAWEKISGSEGDPLPEKEPVVPPVVLEDLDLTIEDVPIEIDEIILIEDKPLKAPEPLSPIKTPEHKGDFHVNIFGVNYRLNFSGTDLPVLNGTDEANISSYWKELSDQKNLDGAIHDLLQYRKEQDLCDWAYFELVDATGAQMSPEDKDKATLLNFYMLCQSGFKVRICRDSAGHLHMICATDSNIAQSPYWIIEGERFFLVDNSNLTSLFIMNNPFPGENPLRLRVTGLNALPGRVSDTRTISSRRYPELKCTVRTNTAQVDFFDTYPVAFIGDDTRTRWYHYAMNPLSAESSKLLYPEIRKHIDGKSELEAVEMILNLIQTGFEYEYDDKLWGGDRTFFAEETLFYPYCDCEDRSILFSRIVRDILGLKVALIYYPGHLATAVRFSSEVKGDYISIGGDKYTVCDPTFINAPVGMTMTGMDNSTAYAIVL